VSGIYPKAVQRLIPPGPNDPPIVPRIAVLHVDAGNAETLYYYFRDRSGGIESHFFIKKDGTVEQYRDIYWQADANLDGNDFAVSIETQGYGAGEWTAAQLTSIKRLLLWLHNETDVPLKRCTAWDGVGVGYHVMWGAPSHWTPVAKTCPGPDRVKQFEALLVPWMERQSKPPRSLLPVQHRIVTANLYVKNDRPAATVGKVIAAVKGRFSFPPDVIACQETHGAGTLAKLATVGDYRLLAADPKFGEAGRELGVLLRRGLKVIDTEFHLAAKGVGDGVTDRDRGVFVVKYVKRRRRVAVVNCHAPVFGETLAVEGKPGPAAVQHAAYAAKVAAIVTRLRKHGWTVFVTADANSRGKWDQSLPVVLERLGMSLTRDGVDLIAHDPKRVIRKAVQLVALGAPGTPESAHEAIAARYIEKRKS